MATRLDCAPVDPGLTRLEAPARNRYYYGKLLDEHHLELEQRYLNLKRWLLNRLSLGHGVLCGLRVHASGAMVRVSPGAAVDGLGREIIVPRESRPVDATQPTDDCGRPVGTPMLGAGTVTLYLCYHECEAEPAPIVVHECEPSNSCENGLVLERYRLRISPGLPRETPGVVTAAQCAAIFGPPPQGSTRRIVACETLATDCSPPEEHCIPLATLELDGDGNVATIDECAYRPNLYSNAVLMDLILCLAARVDLCCGDVQIKALAIEAGDGQAGPVNEPLPDALAVKVTEAGNPVADENVTFAVATGGGAIGDDLSILGPVFTVKSDAGGIAKLPHWRLGAAVGAQQVTASIAAGMPSHVTFNATAEAVETDLPVILAIWPPNAIELSDDPASPHVLWWRRWNAEPRIEITFNHQMAKPALANADPWLRVYQIHNYGSNEIQLQKLVINHAGPAPGDGELGIPGFTEIYGLEPLPADPGQTPPRFLVLIRAEGTAIQDTSSPPLLLDAEYAGTKLTTAQVDEIWKIEAGGLPWLWDALADTGATLPQSGNGVEGGRFESWFSAVIIQG